MISPVGRLSITVDQLALRFTLDELCRIAREARYDTPRGNKCSVLMMVLSNSAWGPHINDNWLHELLDDLGRCGALGANRKAEILSVGNA